MSAALKDFDPLLGGVALDASWQLHRARCERCARFDERRPATAASMCLAGVRLWKLDGAERCKSKRRRP